MSKISISIVTVGLILLAVGVFGRGEWAGSASAQTAPVVSETPGFPVDFTEDEIAAVQAWNQWLFEREQAYKDAMYAQWQIQMGDDAEWLFGSFEASLGQQILELTQEIDSLKNTSNANLDAAVQLQGLVATPEPVIVTEYVEVEVPVEVIVTVTETEIEYIEVPGQGIREPSHYEYCAWLEAKMRQLRDTAENGVDANTYRDVLLGIECEEVGLDL